MNSRPFFSCHWIAASRTVPTLCVPVSRIGPSMKPDSLIQLMPVMSPLPFRLNVAANTGSQLPAAAEGLR